MKPIKDKFVYSDIWYFVLSYLHQTNFQPIYDRHLEKYNDDGRPTFYMEWLDTDTFKELAQEAIEYYMQNAKDITLENIDKYGDK